MPLDRPLEPGDRLVITTLPDGYIYHVETRDGRILAPEMRARSFGDTVARIRSRGYLNDDHSSDESNDLQQTGSAP